MNIFAAVKYCCIFHGRVCVMGKIVYSDAARIPSASRMGFYGTLKIETLRSPVSGLVYIYLKAL